MHDKHKIIKLETALTNILKMTRSSKPDIPNYSTELWQQDKLNFISSVANAALTPEDK